MTRHTGVGRLVLGTLALPLCCLHLLPSEAPAPEPVPYRSVVVETQCTDGRVIEAIDDGNPAGWLAHDTGKHC